MDKYHIRILESSVKNFMRNKILIVIAVVVTFAAFVSIVPLPFKPSLWSVIKDKQIRAQLDKSTEPVYIATEPEYFKDNTGQDRPFYTTFTVYKNWINAYQIGSYYQLSAKSKIGYDSEGPEKEVLALFQKIIDGTACPKKDRPVSYCGISKTNQANQRDFAVVWRDETALIKELTTIYYPDAILADEYYKYKRIDQSEIDEIIKIMTDVKSVDFQIAKVRYFKPVY